MSTKASHNSSRIENLNKTENPLSLQDDEKIWNNQQIPLIYFDLTLNKNPKDPNWTPTGPQVETNWTPTRPQLNPYWTPTEPQLN